MVKRSDEVMLAISVNDKLMEQKHYRPDVVGSILMNVEYDKEKNKYYDTKSNIKKYIRQIAGISNYLSKVLFEFLVENNILEEENGTNRYYVNDVLAPFIKINPMALRFCNNNLSANAFKVYCYLLCKQNIHNTYHHVNNYKFSESQLIDMMGYARNLETEKSIKEILETLKTLGLIDYTESRYYPGQRGSYRELLSVNDVSEIQLKATKQTLQEAIVENEIVDEKFQKLCVDEIVSATPAQISKVYNLKEEYANRLQIAAANQDIDGVWEVYKLLPEEGKRTQNDVNIVCFDDAVEFVLEETVRLLNE